MLAHVAQLAERSADYRKVRGSIPFVRTKIEYAGIVFNGNMSFFQIDVESSNLSARTVKCGYSVMVAFPVCQIGGFSSSLDTRTYVGHLAQEGREHWLRSTSHNQVTKFMGCVLGTAETPNLSSGVRFVSSPLAPLSSNWQDTIL